MTTTTNETPELNKALLINLMKEHNIHQINVTFDGCGDSGQMEDVTLIGENGEEIENDSLIGKACEVCYSHQIYSSGTWSYEKYSRQETIRELAEEVAFKPLEDHFGGWEINEGAYGTVVINADGTGTIDYNQRVVDVEQDSASF